ncbi:hypothetical protein ALC53_11105 [Atta colombica]|uniref:Uncharacterized protein n=1 Tax=Atta colombica TaxID=520822 RepID=A0A195B2E4_9HYME|nr:hypothetical protein ALC53_11105 [Atta colombica]
MSLIADPFLFIPSLLTISTLGSRNDSLSTHETFFAIRGYFGIGSDAMAPISNLPPACTSKKESELWCFPARDS